MQQKDLEKTKKKFETAYFIAKEELPLSKFPKILNLEEMHGVELGEAYRNEITGALMIDYIGKSFARDVKLLIDKSSFFSILIAGSTDASVVEKEAIFILTFEPVPPGSEEIEIKTTFIDLADLKAGDSHSVLNCIKKSFNDIGIENIFDKLVGFGSDGASVNSGKKEGIITLLQNEKKCVSFGWCVAHRLELALKDSLSGTSFDCVDEVILNIYYLYKKSPKKLRQLKELVTIIIIIINLFKS